MPYTLAQAQTLVRQRADMSTTAALSFVSDAELTDYINDSQNEFFDLLVSLYEPAVLAATVQIATVANNHAIALPTGTHRIVRVGAVFDNISVPFRTFTLADAVTSELSAAWSREAPPRYAVTMATPVATLVPSIIFRPVPSAVYTVFLTYVAQPTRLAVPADTLGGFVGTFGDEYIITDACLKCLRKENNPDVALWEAAKGRLIERITSQAAPVDEANPAEMVDVRKRARWRRPDRWY